MNDRPLLLLPRATEANRPVRGSSIPNVHWPSGRRQGERLAPAFEELRHALASEATSLHATAYATAPERVVVFETVGPVDGFITAVKATGLDWLGEFDEDDIPPDDDFFDTTNRNARLSGRLFLVMANQRAIDQLLKMWDRYRADENAPFPTGSATLKALFKQLRAVRRWGVMDRLHETNVLTHWRQDLSLRQEHIRFEAELFYRNDDIKRGKASRALEDAVHAHGGRCASQTVIREIAYHGILVELPSDQVNKLVGALDQGHLDDVGLLQTEDVMFFRPGPASVGVTPAPVTGESEHTGSLPSPPGGEPVVALLDGLPVANHPLLAGRIVVDDPDDWQQNYPAKNRIHGTAMASLLLHDELGSGAPPLSSPLYVRPILRPDERAGQDGRECMPEDCLPVDLLHRAVRRIVLGDGDEGPAAPHVRIISLSLGDGSRHFAGVMSPMARLLDWLAWKHKLLFVVSAGNHSQDIELDVADLQGLQNGELQAAVLRAVAADIRHRKLLAPAESNNAVVVGAAHADRSTFLRVGRRYDPYSDKLPCPYSAVGLGHRRAIKPDVLFAGGRQLLVERPIARNGKAVLEAANFAVEPGQQVAAPNVISMSSPTTCYTRGTSNATALAARHAARICEMLTTLQTGFNGEILEDRFFPIIAKALLIHGARWGDTYATMKRILSPNGNSDELKEQVARFIGYGLADPDRVLGCTERRATLIGCGLLKDGQAKVFTVPLPTSLSGRREWRRLAVTLAWFSPINPAHRNYRKAALWFSDPTQPLKLERTDADWQAVQRGTLQHEIFEGESAAAFSDGDALRLQVNCRADAGDLSEVVPFAVAITLEVAESSSVPIYGEVRARIEPRIAVRSAG
ncbi:MAG TPA: S8 family peptidase [Tepidisphaeraceae bacterium]|nr:S8 family peptidase [Tepidisphaeraceae bacterium]